MNDFEPYRVLAAEIISRACSDYKAALKSGNQTQIRANEAFFRSDLFQIYCCGKYDGEDVIKRIKTRVKKGNK